MFSAHCQSLRDIDLQVGANLSEKRGSVSKVREGAAIFEHKNTPRCESTRRGVPGTPAAAGHAVFGRN